MSELLTDVKKFHEETLENLKSSKANNTLRAYNLILKISALFVQSMDLIQCQLNLKLYLYI